MYFLITVFDKLNFLDIASCVRTVAMFVLLHTDVDMFVVFLHITYYMTSSGNY